MVAFDSKNTLSQAYEHFAKKEYYESRQLLLHEDNSIPLADFYLYEAYLAREELGLKKSQSYLQQAIYELTRKKSSAAFEITLNIALNACLQKDAEALETAIEQGLPFVTPEEPWIHFFKGYLAYLNKDYPEALRFWEKEGTRHWLSNWMKTSFEIHFPEEQTELALSHAEIEQGFIQAARKKLEKYLKTRPEKFHDQIRFLLAYSYFKECDKIAFNKRSETYQKAIEILALISSKNSQHQEKCLILQALNKQIFESIAHNYFDDLPLYITTLEKWQASEELKMLSHNLAAMFNENALTGNREAAAILIRNLSALDEGIFKQFFRAHLLDYMQHALTKENIRHLEDYWSLYKSFPGIDSSSFSSLKETAAQKILSFIENENEELKKTKVYLALWKSLEKHPYDRYVFSKQLVDKAQRMWSLKGNIKKGMALFKIAESLPFSTEYNLIKEDIEQALVKSYKQALSQERIEEFSSILIALKEFNLPLDEILNPNEISNQLEDAQYLYSVKNYSKAYEKANWVLLLNPNNQAARTIAVLTAYEQGCYLDAIEHIKHLKAIDFSIGEILAVSQMLTGDTMNGKFLLGLLSANQPLSQDVIQRIGYGYLVLYQPHDALEWLNKVAIESDEILVGKFIASFQKQEWEKTLELFSQLDVSHQQNPALQALAIQAHVAQNQIDQSNELFARFLVSKVTPFIESNHSKAFALLQKNLHYFDPNDFAARYYLYVKQNADQALTSFYAINNPSPELLFERAQLSFSMKHYSQAIQDLEKALPDLKTPYLENALSLMGSAYLQIGFYPDSVKAFSELFYSNPQQDANIQKAYADALVAIGRFDLAAPHLIDLGLSLPSSLMAPQELALPFEMKSSPHKRLKALEFYLTQHPKNISLQILIIKELLSQSENSKHPSEELLLAFEKLEELNDQTLPLPEVCFLQGQVLKKLHFYDSAKKAFTKSILLNPYYVDAYKLLADVNIYEHDSEAAMYNLRQVLKIAPQDLGALKTLAAIYETKKQLLEAVEIWTQIVKLQPADVTCLIKLAKLNLSCNKPQEALTAIEQACTLSPKNQDCWKVLQQVLQHPSNGKVTYHQ